jgi:hypothetical protein
MKIQRRNDMKALRDLVVPVAVLLLATGCASANPFQQQGDAAGRTTQGNHRYNEAATLALENNNWSEVTVYLIHLGSETWLGRIPSMTERTLRVSPQHFDKGNGVLQFLVRSNSSGESFVTEPMRLSGGERIEIEVLDHLQISTYSVGVR